VKGIAPRVLRTQVEATAAWAEGPAADVVRSADAIEDAWRADPEALPYLRLLLSAQYLTVATFCPTDVDARIRHHYWDELAPNSLREALAIVDAIDGLDPRPVSARVLVDEARGTLSGHDGEWFSVRAGALGRALALGYGDAAELLSTAIEDELAREAAIFDAALASGDVAQTLRAATILAHNVGDLSRVVEAWPNGPAHAAARARLSKLGHAPDRARYGGVFYVAGAINKDVMALENHRFLALRKPRALRASRELLLPIGPFFEPWGRTVARLLEERDRAEVVGALLETFVRGPEQAGALRALRGIAEQASGPWSRVIDELPVRLRKVATSGEVVAGMRVTDAAFRARLDNRFRASLAAATQRV
jgi:hypothetical protein